MTLHGMAPLLNLCKSAVFIAHELSQMILAALDKLPVQSLRKGLPVFSSSFPRAATLHTCIILFWMIASAFLSLYCTAYPAVPRRPLYVSLPPHGKISINSPVRISQLSLSSFFASDLESNAVKKRFQMKRGKTVN